MEASVLVEIRGDRDHVEVDRVVANDLDGVISPLYGLSDVHDKRSVTSFV